MILMKNLFKNPITIWINWVLKTLLLKIRFLHSNLKVGYLSYAKNCKFGNNNTIYENVTLMNVEIGDFSYVNSHSCIARTKIGKFCSIGENVKCGLGKHPSQDMVSTHPAFYSKDKSPQITFADKNYFDEYSTIEIGNDVWIGSNSMILDGVKIANGAIVASGTVVTKDVPPYAIVGGVPAKIIKYRFDENEIKFLNEIKWWNKDTNWIKNNFKDFHDIKIFINLPCPIKT